MGDSGGILEHRALSPEPKLAPEVRTSGVGDVTRYVRPWHAVRAIVFDFSRHCPGVRPRKGE